MSRTTNRTRTLARSNLAVFLAHVVDEQTGEHDERKAAALFYAILGFEADIAAGLIEPLPSKRNARRRRATIVADVLNFMTCEG